MNRFAHVRQAKAASTVEITQPAVVRSSKILSLLLILEALRQEPVVMAAQKV